MAHISPNASHVGIAGDWHRHTDWALRMIDIFDSHRIKTILHVGDFGLYPGVSGSRYVNALDRKLADLGMTLYVTPGNHDDYDQIDAIIHSADGLLRLTPRIVFMPRGHRWTWGAHRFMSLGGAPSVNFENLIEGSSWWRQETLTLGDIMRVQEKVESHGTVDVMITHDAPEGVKAIEREISSNPHGYSEKGIQYASESRKLMTAGWETARPSLLFHGHYHINVDETLESGDLQTRIVGLHRDGHSGNIASLALDDLRVLRLN